MSEMTQDLTALSFPAAIAFTQDWLQTVEKGERTDGQILADMKALLSHAQGVRGFFVAFLTGESALADHPPEIFLQGFAQSLPHISSILIKNVAMSTAMALTHERNGDPEQRAGSLQVQRRSQHLIQQLQSFPGADLLAQERSALLAAIQENKGEYEDFLQRWQYDQTQRDLIRQALETL